MGEWVRGRDLSVPVGCRDETDFARVAIPEVGGGGGAVWWPLPHQSQPATDNKKYN